MKKSDIVQLILAGRHFEPSSTMVEAYAPSNIALCKYWGKRDQALNLPVTPSLSISLGAKGTITQLSQSDSAHDTAWLNDQPIDWATPFGRRLEEFLNLFRPSDSLHFKIVVKTNIPIGAGLASSASGFASLVQALDLFFQWELTDTQLSILSRMGSGSASRSIWQGFVEWHAGVRDDGMDSFAQPIEDTWPELCVGLLVLDEKEKAIGSRDAMQRTVTTSPLYSAWPAKVKLDMSSLKHAIMLKDFAQLGKTAESNAMTMHATMLSAWPPVCYSSAKTVTEMHKIWQLRQDGLPLYFTQDAGPNLKLLFLENDISAIQDNFPNVEIVRPFAVTH